MEAFSKLSSHLKDFRLVYGTGGALLLAGAYGGSKYNHIQVQLLENEKKLLENKSEIQVCFFLVHSANFLCRGSGLHSRCFFVASCRSSCWRPRRSSWKASRSPRRKCLKPRLPFFWFIPVAFCAVVPLCVCVRFAQLKMADKVMDLMVHADYAQYRDNLKEKLGKETRNE